MISQGYTASQAMASRHQPLPALPSLIPTLNQGRSPQDLPLLSPIAKQLLILGPGEK